ncbi:30S ribosomal protein S1 [Candidatus Hepatincolaceae symbiont of Richtersius coronifer]
MKQQQNFNDESFADLFKESVSKVHSFENHIVKGVIIGADQYYLTVDVGLKSEGKILVSEFKDQEGKLPEFKIGQEVEVYIDRYEDQEGNIMLSREKAKREEAWYDLERQYQEGTPVMGFVTKRVKGGFSVLVNDTLAFLPGSQLDIRPIKNINGLVGTTQTLQILKMDKKRFNLVVSRKAIISKNMADNNAEGQEQYEEGQIVEGTVKNVTGYGAFIDLGYVDGLLHVTDISWSRINHPSEVLQLGQVLKLKITKINPENKRISLGIKQLTEDPWSEVVEKYKLGEVFAVKITNITDYGVFVELAKGVEGLVHISEMSWVKKDINPKTDFKIGEEVKVKVLEIDAKKRRMNLSIKQCEKNPWLEYASSHPEGSEVTVEVKEINDGGLVVKLDTILEGFIRLHDLSWENKDKDILTKYQPGDKVKCKIIKNDLEKDKILLGVKQLTEDPFASALDNIKKGSVVKCKVVSHNENGLEVEVKAGILGFIKKIDLAIERENQNVEDFPVNSEVEALVIQISSSSRNINLSIKALEVNEQKKQMTAPEEGNFALGDTLGEALNKKDQPK